MRNVNRLPSVTPARAATLAFVLMLAGCSLMESSSSSGDSTMDYRSGATKIAPLDVPPDLTQLQRDNRFQPQSGTVSANQFQSPTPAGAASAPGVQRVAPQQVGDVHLVKAGDSRWLVTSQTPEQLWPQLRTFWEERGFKLAVDSPETGMMETTWAENRAKIPDDFIRRTIGKVFDNAFSTGERDKFRTRVERTPEGTEIYISHQGVQEVLNGDQTTGNYVWQPRPVDPTLEGEMLSRLMLKLGAKEQEARAATAAAAAASGAQPAGPVHARLVAGQPAATLQVDEPFDRAWRRVGLALDRAGFTVEDRDRANGLYYVRYADPKMAGQDEPGFFSRLFGGDKKSGAPGRYRIEVKRGGGDSTMVSVLNPQGQPDNTDVAQRIVSLLVDDLK